MGVSNNADPSREKDNQMAMSEENKQKARERMKAMHAKKKAKQPEESLETLRAKIAELEKAQPVKEESKEVKILRAYQQGRSSIQTIARVFGVDVGEVLDIIGEGSLNTVTFVGDQISEQEAGSDTGRAPTNHGLEKKVPFDLS